MKITEKGLKDTCSTMNRGIMASTPFGVTVSRETDGYYLTLTKRGDGSRNCLGKGLSASEADTMITGFTLGLAITPGARMCQCGKEMLEAKAKLTGVTYWLCRQCGKAVEA